MPEPDKNPWKLEGVKAVIGLIGALVLGITTGAWVMYKQVNQAQREVEDLRAKVMQCHDDLQKFEKEGYLDLLKRVSRLEGVTEHSSLPKASPAGPAAANPPGSSTSPPAAPPASPTASNNPPANPGPSAPAAPKAAAQAEGVTAEVMRTKKTANGVVFQVRITSPDRKSMVFFQRYKDLASRASLNDRGPANLTFSDREDAPESQRKPLLNVAVNPGSPMIFYAFAPGDPGAAGTGSCRELQLVARLNDGTPLSFVLTSFPLD